MEKVLAVNEGDGAFDGRFGGHAGFPKRNNPTEALRRVSRVRSILIIGRFCPEIKRNFRERDGAGSAPTT
jgi:hypothetical protein